MRGAGDVRGRKTVTRRVIRYTAGDVYKAACFEGRWVEGMNHDDPPPSVVEWYCKNYKSPPYEPGDILYVRETWRIRSAHRFEADAKIEYKAGGPITTVQFPGRCSDSHVRKEYDDFINKWMADPEWRPSIHMPKEAARIFLRVKAVRVERLQDSFFAPISPIFAMQAEGMDIGDYCRECIATYGNPCCVDTVDEDGSKLYGGECGILDEVRENYAELWDSTAKKADRDKYGWRADPWVWVIEFERVENPELLEVRK